MWFNLIAFSIVFVFAIALFLQLVGFIERLKLTEPELYEDLGGSKLELFGGSLKAQRELMNYINNGEYKNFNDPKLIKIGNNISNLNKVVIIGFIIVFIIGLFKP